MTWWKAWVICGLFGFWIGMVEALLSLSLAVFDPEAGRPFAWWVNSLAHVLDYVSVRDNLVSVPLLGLALFGPAAGAAFLLSRRTQPDGPNRWEHTVVLAVSALVLMEAWFHLQWSFSGGVIGAPEQTRWGVLLPGLAAGIAFLIYQWLGFAKPRRAGFFFRLAMQAGWIVAGLVLVDAWHQSGGIFSLTVWSGITTGIVVGGWLGYRGTVFLAGKLIRGPWTRGFFARVLAAAAAGVFAYAFYYECRGEESLPRSSASASGPNLVMLVLDTVRADHLSGYGYFRPTTPNLDRLAREGAKFTRAYTVSPWTLPSHASFFTGLYPSEHGCESGHLYLDSQSETLAEILHRRGYTTLAFSANPWINRYTGLDQGFERLILIRFLFGKSLTLGHGLWRWYLLLLDPQSLIFDNGAREANRMCFKWLRGIARRPRPFFLFVNYMEAHIPYPANAETYRFFPDPARGSQDYRAVDFDWIKHDAGARTWSESELDLVRAKYDGSLYYLDQRVGELIQELDRLGLGADTLLVVLSDHGEGLGEHHLWGHEFSLYHNLLHVPLILRYPSRIPPGAEIHACFSLKDLPRLILELLGGQTPAVFLPTAEPEEPPALIAERFVPRNLIRLFKERFPDYDLERLKRDQKSVIRYPYHLIWDSKSADELYRLDQDPGELTNLVGRESAVYRELVNQITIFQREHPLPLLPGPESEPAMDPETAARLRALGYLK